jgi:hypothetical protein
MTEDNGAVWPHVKRDGNAVVVHPAELTEAARLADLAAQNVRRERMTAEYGKPEHMDEAEALALARTALGSVTPDVTVRDVYASIYRDGEAAEAWLEANRVHYGHPALARVPLPDGRVLGILDLRPALMSKAAGTERLNG